MELFLKVRFVKRMTFGQDDMSQKYKMVQVRCYSCTTKVSHFCQTVLLAN